MGFKWDKVVGVRNDVDESLRAVPHPDTLPSCLSCHFYDEYYLQHPCTVVVPACRKFVIL